MDLTKLQRVIRRKLPKGFWFEGLFSDGTSEPVRKTATRPYEFVAVHTGSYAPPLHAYINGKWVVTGRAEPYAIGYLSFHTTLAAANKAVRSYGEAESVRIIPVTKSELVFGGDLLGWTTQAEVNALDNSIATDY